MAKHDNSNKSMIKVLFQAAIPQEKIDNLIKSIDRRVKARRLAKGWHIKY
jgi:hypothetical protein